MKDRWIIMEYPLINAVVYTIVGMVLFLAAFFAAGRWFPFDLRKEIIQERHDVNAEIADVSGAIRSSWTSDVAENKS